MKASRGAPEPPDKPRNGMPSRSSPPTSHEPVCLSPPLVADASVDQLDADVCPDPNACCGEFKFIDGSMNPVSLYPRDGSFSEVPCPQAPPQCPVA